MIPALMATFPEGYVPSTFDSGFDKFLRAEDELIARASGELGKWKEQVRATTE